MIKLSKTCASFILYWQYSQHCIAFISASITYPATILAGGQFDPLLFAFVYCATFVVYNIDRLPNLSPEDKINQPQRCLWFKENRSLQNLQIALAVVALIPLTLKLNLYTILVALSVGFAALLYSFPLIPIKGKIYRLKTLARLKEIYLTSSWIVATCIIPLSQTTSSFTIDWLWFSLLLALNYFVSILFLELRDTKGDAQFHINSLSLSWGMAKTCRYAKHISLMTALLSVTTALFHANGVIFWGCFLCSISLFFFGFKFNSPKYRDFLLDFCLSLPYWTTVFFL